MPIDYAALQNSPRLLLEAQLRPLQGDRFQPTGFPDLGAGRYTLPDGTEMLLVESAQSVANRMELACWDEANDDLIPELKGLPYVRIDCGDLGKTNTLKEFHRLNSPYIWEGRETDESKKFREAFMSDLGLKPSQKRKQKGEEEGEDNDVPGVLDFRKFYRAVFRRDPNSVLHGVFLEKVAGRLRMARALSGFIEATGVRPAEHGGTKVDHILPSPKVIGLDAKTGYGNVPFHRTEFVAQEIKAYFNLDLALLRGYALGNDATQLLIALALFKIRRFLSEGLRLRTACDLKLTGDVIVTQPDSFKIPPESELLQECTRLINNCQRAKVELPEDAAKPKIPDDLNAIVEFEPGTSGKVSHLTFPKGLTADLAEKTMELFAGAPEIHKAIDHGLSARMFAEVLPVKWEPAAAPKAKVDLPAGTTEPVIPEDLKKLIKFKKGTASKAPRLTFSKGLTADLAEKTKALFPDAPVVHQAIDDALIKSAETKTEDERTSDEHEENQQ